MDDARTAARRQAFEAWISAPPFKHKIERMGEESAWPGSYRPLDVDLAWHAYSAGVAAERERLLSELRMMHAQVSGRHTYYLYAAEMLAGKL